MREKDKQELRSEIVFLIVFFLTLIALIFLGCNRQKKPMYGVGIRFSSSRKPPKQESDPFTKFNYHLEPGKAFSGYYLVENVRPKKQRYLITTFLDYRQVPFWLNGKKAISHEISLDKFKKNWWPFKIDALKMGSHDFMMLVFWDPNVHSTNENFRMGTEFGYASANRANLFVGKGGFPPLSLMTPVSQVPQGNQSNLGGLRINKEKDSLGFWLKEEVKPSQKVNYYIHLGNISGKSLGIGLIALLDFKQIPLNKDQPVIFSQVSPDKVATYRASFDAPKKRGVHELVVLWARNPFVKLADANKDDDFMEPSIRVPIVVK